MAIENPNLRVVLFYSISLVLSLIIVIVSSTVFIVVIYLNGSVAATFLSIFLAVMSVNIAILTVSLRKIIKFYSAILPDSANKRLVVTSFNRHLPSPHPVIPDEKDFTQIEIEIIDLLKRNRNRMLQNLITSSLSMSKATVSRTLTSLENKGSVVRFRKGMTNEVILAEIFAE